MTDPSETKQAESPPDTSRVSSDAIDSTDDLTAESAIDSIEQLERSLNEIAKSADDALPPIVAAENAQQSPFDDVEALFAETGVAADSDVSNAELDALFEAEDASDTPTPGEAVPDFDALLASEDTQIEDNEHAIDSLTDIEELLNETAAAQLDNAMIDDVLSEVEDAAHLASSEPVKTTADAAPTNSLAPESADFNDTLPAESVEEASIDEAFAGEFASVEEILESIVDCHAAIVQNENDDEAAVVTSVGEAAIERAAAVPPPPSATQIPPIAPANDAEVEAEEAPNPPVIEAEETEAPPSIERQPSTSEPPLIVINNDAAQRTLDRIDQAARTVLSAVNFPLRLMPQSVRPIVDWVALSLVFWVPIVWAIAWMM